MSGVRLMRLAGSSAVTGGALLLLTQIIDFVSIDRTDPAASAGELPVVVSSGLKLIGFVLILLGLIGLFLRQTAETGTFGLVTFLLAFLGTMLIAGDVWLETFAAPYIAERAPKLIEETGGTLAVGGLISFSLFAIGWVLFALVSVRAGVLPRPAAVLLLVGGAVGFLILSLPGGGVLFAAAMVWLGLSLVRFEGPPERTR